MEQPKEISNWEHSIPEQPKESSWEERLMDEFCVMFERAGEEYPAKLEQFIQETIDKEKEEIREMIYQRRHSTNGKSEQWYQAYDELIDLI